MQHSAAAQWGSFLQTWGWAAHCTFCEPVMILCYIPFHSPGSAKLISVNIKNPKRSREITYISADKSLCLMEASSYRKSCDSQAKLLWLKPFRYFFIFFLRQNLIEKKKKKPFRYVYLLMEYFQLRKLSAHAELFCQPILFINSWSVTLITLSQKFEIGFLFHFYPLKSMFSENFLLSQVTEIKSIPVVISFHFWRENVLGNRMVSARSVIPEPAPALIQGGHRKTFCHW